MANETTPDSEETPPPAAWRDGSPDIAGATHVGVVRRINQDAFGRFDDPNRRETLLVVADGLGGHRGGEVASRMAVDQIVAVMGGSGAEDGVAGPDRAARLRAAIESANEAILKESRRDRTLEGMGTTIVALLLAEDGETWVAHVGDSRLYRVRETSIEGLTEDHSLVATLVREGVLDAEEARNDPRRNQILRALGVRDDVEVEVAALERCPGDTYLLCSDGLHGMLEDEAIRSIVARPEPPEARVEALIDAANAAGGTDNVTCLLAIVPDARTTGLRGSASRWLAATRSALRGAAGTTDASDASDTSDLSDDRDA